MTSAVTRRVEQLESALGTRLLERSTRGLTLTTSAEALLPKFSRIVAEIDDLLRNSVGCCWILMALLFVVGIMNVLWIAVLALLVLLEKLTPWGRWVARLAGAACVAAGVRMMFS